MTPTIARLLKTGIEEGVSDWHLDTGKKPAWRVNGKLVILDGAGCLSDADVTSIRDTAKSGSSKHDFVLRWEERLFRGSATLTRQGQSVVLRHVEQTVPSLQELGAPTAFVHLLEGDGLVLITGSTGAGKSTTLNSAIRHLNTRGTGGAVVILGDPIECYHDEVSCRLRYREFRSDFDCWSAALEETLRQDPDVICLTELRDASTMSIALAAADTGHLVLATMHNRSAKDAISRILETCPDSDREQQRALLAKALRGVLSQQLVPALNGGRVAAFEMLINTDAVANLIREKRFRQIDDEILRGRQFGMRTMTDSLSELVRNGAISAESARNHAATSNTGRLL